MKKGRRRRGKVEKREGGKEEEGHTVAMRWIILGMC
jgi:hypothetical protein